MIRIFILSLLCCTMTIAPARADDVDLSAQEDIPLGFLEANRPEAKKPATPEQIDEALQVSEECKNYNVARRYFDCDCVGMKFLELRQKEGDEASQFNLMAKARHECPNTPEVAGIYYDRCVSWAVVERGEDYKEFCTCYANQFALLYSKNPDDNQLVREAQLTQALSNCNVGGTIAVRQNRLNFLERIKQKGLLGAFLPGSDEATKDQE